MSFATNRQSPILPFLRRTPSEHCSSIKDNVETLDNYITDENWSLLSVKGQSALKELISNDSEGAQKHIYADWPPKGVDDEGKIKLSDQLADLSSSYPGGLEQYISKSKILLRESELNVNPFADYTAIIPEGQRLDYESSSQNNFDKLEKIGLQTAGKSAFVLVAGGLGERLGYSGIKLELETDLCSGMSYLETYIKFILALEKRIEENRPIELVIMTSGDTDSETRLLLSENNYFGMTSKQIQIIQQDKVPALKDGKAGLSIKSRWEVATKPHGHGDVHQLLYKEGIVERWVGEGRTHVVFLQDTNALVVNSILSTIGVSVERGFHMNSICIPRLAEEAAGAIARLEHKTDPSKSLVINVEYNQLDPLLSQNNGKGDVPDPSTGYSPFPGNSNILILELSSYLHTLRGEDQGVVTEFVNPKYADESRMKFKKATRLECMMQDFPKLLQKEMGAQANVGFTMFDRWFTFSPAKNSLESGKEAVLKGSDAPGTMSSAESDIYIQNQRKLAYAGMDILNNQNLTDCSGIPITPGPRIILSPSFALTRDDISRKIIGGQITERSSLILEGEGITMVRNLDLDGALVVKAGAGCEIELDGLEVTNKGWEMVEIGSDEKNVEEKVAIRGYRMIKHETLELSVEAPGKYKVGKDGTVKKLD